jgi:hypothetical protein
VAYFSAYYLKGNDLRINKLDVVDVVAELDAEGSESHGTWAHGATWFTLFSPRIQNYTVGIEPNFPKWGPDAAADKSAPRNPNSTLVTWFGKPEDTWGGTGRASSPSLFRRAYDYAPDASGLTGVPIQVWSSKSFAASWQERLTDQTPLFSADLTHPPGNPQLLSGTVTNHLPVKLLDVTLFYRGKAYKIGELQPGRTRIDDLVQDKNKQEMEQWFQDTQFLVTNYQYNYSPYGNRPGKPQNNAPAALTKLLMFNEANDKGNQGTRLDNALLRPLDASWRLRPGREEVIVVGKVTSETPYDQNGGPAEKVTQDAVTATRLWLGSLPGSEKARPPLVGIVKQDTYVRVFLPIAPADMPKKEAEK